MKCKGSDCWSFILSTTVSKGLKETDRKGYEFDWNKCASILMLTKRFLTRTNSQINSANGQNPYYI